MELFSKRLQRISVNQCQIKSNEAVRYLYPRHKSIAEARIESVARENAPLECQHVEYRSGIYSQRSICIYRMLQFFLTFSMYLIFVNACV